MAKIYSEHCVTKPVNLPLTLQETKDFLRITFQDDDALLTNMIATAAQRFQKYTSRALIWQNWEVSYRQVGRVSLTLPIKPIVKIIKTQLISIDGKSADYDISNIDLDSEASEIVFNVFPYAYILKITYKAGYGLNASDIPSDIKTLLLTHVAHMYENRSIATDFSPSLYNEFKLMRI